MTAERSIIWFAQPPTHSKMAFFTHTKLLICFFVWGGVSSRTFNIFNIFSMTAERSTCVGQRIQHDSTYSTWQLNETFFGLPTCHPPKKQHNWLALSYCSNTVTRLGQCKQGRGRGVGWVGRCWSGGLDIAITFLTVLPPTPNPTHPLLCYPYSVWAHVCIIIGSANPASPKNNKPKKKSPELVV